MNREELTNALDLVLPALSESDETVMGCFWFCGDRLLAYNDQIAISVPMVTDFVVAAPRYLPALLNASTAVDVKMVVSKDTLLLSAGRGKFKLPVLRGESFAGQFTMPKSKMVTIPEDQRAQLLKALQCCSLSISKDLSRPEYLGVTVLSYSDVDARQVIVSKLALYATNGKTLSHARVAGQGWFFSEADSVILPSLFVQQAIKFIQTAGVVKLGVHSDHVLMSADDVLLFGRLVANARPIDFPVVFDRNFPKSARKTVVDIPDTFQNVLNRAIIINDGGDVSSFDVLDGTLEVVSKSPRGEVRDLVSVEQDDVQLKLNPRLILNGLTTHELFVFVRECLVMVSADGKCFYLVAKRS